MGDPVESALDLTINADYPRCSARGVLQRVRGERDWVLGVRGLTTVFQALEHGGRIRSNSWGGGRGGIGLSLSTAYE